MTTSLAGQQEALLRALWQPGHAEALAVLAQAGVLAPCSATRWQRGLTAYRSNAHELAHRALAGAYPVVAQLLGEENFRALAAGLWRRYPPERGDLAQWGGRLPFHVESLAGIIEQEPFVADVARIEWRLHLAATAADARLDLPSLQRLAQEDPADFTLLLAPGTACQESEFPIVSIVHAHLQGEPSLEEAGRRLRDGIAQTGVVWREGFRPRLREALPGEAAFIAALQDRRSLAESLRAAAGFDFNAWLTPAVRSGLMTGTAT